MSTLVIQLGRLGDVIQTTPLLQQISAKNPSERLDILLLEPNDECLTGLRGITTIRTVSEDLKLLDDRIAVGFAHHEIPVQATQLLRELDLPAYDLVINASHAALGCWLAGQIPCASREGGVITQEGECLYAGGAHVYRIASIGFREQNWFNLVDLLRCDGSRPLTEETKPKLYVNIAEELPFNLPAGRRIALNVGASEKHRRWPARHFAQLTESLQAMGLTPLLVGAPSDRAACNEVEALSRAMLPNLAGKTSISHMARIVKECDLLISADTGAVHVAAAVGTCVVGLYG